MVEERTPQFCSVCGTKLAASQTTLGFDPYTGEREQQESLYCPNPTVHVEQGILNKKVTTTYHPAWSNAAGHWEQL